MVSLCVAQSQRSLKPPGPLEIKRPGRASIVRDEITVAEVLSGKNIWTNNTENVKKFRAYHSFFHKITAAISNMCFNKTNKQVFSLMYSFFI